MTDPSVEPNLTTTTGTSADPFADGDIVARAGTYYRNTRYLMFVLLVGMGGWFMYDGYVKYPRENQIVARLKSELDVAQREKNDADAGRIAAELKNHEEHNDAALRIQRVLGFTLPPIGAFMLFRSLRNSRGEYRLSGTKLSVPGHPTIDLDEITSVNSDLWDRKGIAWIDYKTAAGETGEITLDDFVYERPPTDAIYDRIADKLGLVGDDEDDLDSASATENADRPVDSRDDVDPR